MREVLPTWSDLPESVRVPVELDLGARVVTALRQTPEYRGGLAARLQLDDGRWVFVKAIDAGDRYAAAYRAEVGISAGLPPDAPVPRLLSSVDSEFCAVVYSDIEGTRPKLRPGSPDLSAVLTALGALSRTMTPCPLDKAPPVLDELGPLLSGWRDLLARRDVRLDSWSARNLEALVAMETSWFPWARGNTLLHNDLHPGNLVLTGPGRVLVTNWRRPARGAAWLDLLSLVPHMLAEGHEPADIDRLLKRRPVLADVPTWAITGFAVALAGYATRAELLPATNIPASLRAYQQRVATATRGWVAHRTRWR